MTNLYKAEVTSQIGKAGVHVWWSVGTPVTVNGSPMVQLAHGTIVPAAGWSATVNEAANVAADQIDNLRLVLIEQSDQLRAKVEVKP